MASLKDGAYKRLIQAEQQQHLA